MSKLNKRLGFIGIGLMGRPMTLRLLEAGFNVNVWNRSKEKLHAVVAAGASPSDTIQHLVDNSDVLLLSLSDTAAVHSVVFGSEGIAAFGKSHQYLIDLSSIQPEATVQMAQKLKASCSIPWVDAPVSGGVSGAEQGHLAIMAGGEEPSITVAREVLRPIYRQITRMGPVGSGQVTKICNQMIVSCNALVIAEMMNLAKNAGIDIHKITDALSGGFADSKPLQILAPEMASEKFEPIKWRVQTLLKDLTMALELSSHQGNSLPMTGLAAQLLQLHAEHGYLDKDPATLIKLFN